jgi:hypothetical protein
MSEFHLPENFNFLDKLETVSYILNEWFPLERNII